MAFLGDMLVSWRVMCCKTEFSEKLCKWKKYWKNLGLGGNQSCCEHAFLKRYICTVYIYIVSMYPNVQNIYLPISIYLIKPSVCLYIYTLQRTLRSLWTCPTWMVWVCQTWMLWVWNIFLQLSSAFKKHIWRFPMLIIHDQQELQSSSGPKNSTME